MFKRLRQLFGSGQEQLPDEEKEVLANAWYEEKSKLMEALLGRD